ncbi:MAG: hypothetical protein EON58_04790 [Alphaproteobacteria bacterium]|nr:MAG: hypothetical protein EON58_04790 [Alphaproteobacteria bacterium]
MDANLASTGIEYRFPSCGIKDVLSHSLFVTSQAFLAERVDEPNIESLLSSIETMLLDSYTRGEDPDQWWLRFARFYLDLPISEKSRTSLVSKLDWLFSQHGETGWSLARMHLLAGSGTANKRMGYTEGVPSVNSTSATKPLSEKLSPLSREEALSPT